MIATNENDPWNSRCVLMARRSIDNNPSLDRKRWNRPINGVHAFDLGRFAEDRLIMVQKLTDVK